MKKKFNSLFGYFGIHISSLCKEPRQEKIVLKFELDMKFCDLSVHIHFQIKP